MNKIKVRPSKSGLKVTNPKHGRFIKEEGEVVELNIYWKRMLKCGDVVEVKKEQPVKKKQTKKINKDSEE